MKMIEGSNWAGGTVEGLEVQACVFTESSRFGMVEDARISKLYVQGEGVSWYFDRQDRSGPIDARLLALVVSAVGDVIA